MLNTNALRATFDTNDEHLNPWWQKVSGFYSFPPSFLGQPKGIHPPDKIVNLYACPQQDPYMPGCDLIFVNIVLGHLRRMDPHPSLTATWGMVLGWFWWFSLTLRILVWESPILPEKLSRTSCVSSSALISHQRSLFFVHLDKINLKLTISVSERFFAFCPSLLLSSSLREEPICLCLSPGPSKVKV